MSLPDHEPIPGISLQFWRALGPQERARLRDLHMEMNIDPALREQNRHDPARDGPQGNPYMQLSNARGDADLSRQQYVVLFKFYTKADILCENLKVNSRIPSHAE